MTYDEALAWARRWIDEWNRHDVEAVLAHFSDDVEFVSPVAATVTGDPSGVVRGKDALRAYWTTALGSRPDLHFELDDVHLGIDAIAIRYRNQAGRGCTEIAVFDTDGQVARGWGLYDAG
ncbi:MAG TPA: nuclear transport factor 2 family protein [Acidimicrobiia bacterium]|nr:nuclear transport factor 2 family protein [Acidimicrobiia bacterium]